MSHREILVIAEFDCGEPTALSQEMICYARRLADDAGFGVTAIALATDGQDTEKLDGFGADRIIIVRNERFSPYAAEAWLPDLVAVLEDLRPDLTLVGHSAQGTDLAPRLAFRMGGDIITNVIEIEIAESGEASALRDCYGGKAREWLQTSRFPAVISIKPKSQAAAVAQSSITADISSRASCLSDEDIVTRIVSREPRLDNDVSLDRADLIVAGGRGVKGTDGFTLIGEVADLIGGSLGASRVACELDWCPADRQIGLTGATVAPRLYFAFGISGASQHMAGCRGAGTIVAINTDPDAAIFDFATYGVVLDCREFAEALISEIEKRKAKGGAEHISPEQIGECRPISAKVAIS